MGTGWDLAASRGKPLVVPFGFSRSMGDGKPKANEERSGKVQVSVARYLRTPPYAAKRKGLSFGYPSCLRSQSDRSTVVVGNCTFGPITVVPHRAKAGLFRRSSILFRPHPPPTREYWWSRRVPPPGPIRLFRARLSP